jgi:hypothetical protein
MPIASPSCVLSSVIRGPSPVQGPGLLSSRKARRIRCLSYPTDSGTGAWDKAIVSSRGSRTRSRLRHRGSDQRESPEWSPPFLREQRVSRKTETIREVSGSGSGLPWMWRFSCKSTFLSSKCFWPGGGVEALQRIVPSKGVALVIGHSDLRKAPMCSCSFFEARRSAA